MTKWYTLSGEGQCPPFLKGGHKIFTPASISGGRNGPSYKTYIMLIHHACSPSVTFPLFCCHGRNELRRGIHAQNKFC